MIGNISTWLQSIPDNQTLNLIEKRRLEHQVTLNKASTLKERNKLGQFATPPALAADILQETKKMMSQAEKQAIRWLDPAFGTGSFLSASVRVFGARNLESATAVELHQLYLTAAQQIWSGTPLNLVPGDFTALVPEDRHKASLLVCNPPFVRHHHLELDEKVRLQQLSQEVSGIQLNLQAGLYCHFMLLAHQWLLDNALSVWLVPSEILDTKYGIPMRRYLTEKVDLVRVHRYLQSDLHFDDALVSCTVIWFRKRPASPRHQILRTAGSSASKPSEKAKAPNGGLAPNVKWTTDFLIRPERQRRPTVVLGDLFDIKRGLATGANTFFIMTEEQASQLEIPLAFFRPILPRPRNLGAEHVQRASDGYPANVQRLLLFDTRLSIDELQQGFPAVWQYLLGGIASDVPNKKLCEGRTPWYSQEIRPSAPFLSAYITSNTKSKTSFPLRFILNDSDATATNSYLMLYPKAPLKAVLDVAPELRLGVWDSLKRIGNGSEVRDGRTYAGGLVKLEPRELAQVTAEPLVEYLTCAGYVLPKPTQL